MEAEELRFEEWADTWFEHHKYNIKPTTQESYRYTLRILKDYFGRWKLRDIKAMRVEEFLGLEPHHIKADGSEINIAQAMVMVKSTASIGTPKSNDSYRTIPILESARHYARQPCNPTYVSQLQALGVSMETYWTM